jgi:hypothetical protein
MTVCLQIPTFSISGRIRVSDGRQMEIHTAEPLVPEPRPSEVEMSTAKLKKYKSPGSDQIPENRFKQEVKYYGLRSIS